MSEALRWEFSILDKVSSPADQMAKSLKGARGALDSVVPALAEVDKKTAEMTLRELRAAVATKDLSKQIDGLTKQLQPVKRLTVEMGNMFHSFAGFRKEADGRWIFNLADGLSTVADAVGRVVSGIGGLISGAAQVAGTAEKTRRAWGFQVGGATAGDLSAYIGGVAETSRGQYTRQGLSELVSPLVQQGLGARDIQYRLAAAMDAAARGGDKGGAIGAFSGLRGKHSIDASGLSALGITRYEDQLAASRRLAKAAGVPALTGLQSPDEILGNVSQRISGIGKRRTGKVEETLLDILQERAGGKLGTLGAGAQVGADATLERFANIQQTLFEKLTGKGSLDGLISALDKFTDAVTSPKFINALSVIVDKLAAILDRIAGYLGEKSAADKVRESGGVAFEDAAGNLTGSISNEEKFKLAKRWYARNGKKQPNNLGYVDALDSIAGSQYEYERKRQGLGTVLRNPSNETSPADAEQFGFSLAAGMDRYQQAKAAGPPANIPQAHDMIWRGNDAVQIDPQDTVMAFKRGGSLGLGGPGGGGGASITLQFGDINVGGGGDAAHQAAEILEQIREQAPASMLLSQLEQMVSEVGAGSPV